MALLTDLPNELLSEILRLLPSITLLHILSVSRRTYQEILHILLHRINTALLCDNHHLIFECFPPSAKATTPYLHCAYLGTWRIDNNGVSDTSSTANSSVNDVGDHSSLGSLYSHFLPTRAEHSSTTMNAAPNPTPPVLPETLIPTSLSLDQNTLFTLLTPQASLVKIGPMGRFSSVVEVFEEPEMRVQRAWLGRAEEATNKRFGDEGELSMREENLGDGHGGRYGDGREVDGNPENEQEEQERILWIGEKKIAGLKVRVREKRFSRRQQPLLMATDEEPAVTYALYYESLMVRTVHLLVTLEKSWEEQAAYNGPAGMAVVYGGAAGVGAA